MIHRGEAVLEEVDELRLVRHLRQPRVGAHEKVLAGVLRHQRGAALDLHLAVSHVEQHGLGSDLVVELVHHALFELVRLSDSVRGRVAASCAMERSWACG
jgi:hypothetical protein